MRTAPPRPAAAQVRSSTLPRSRLGIALPPADTRCWSARRKESVIRGIETGQISLGEACRHYGLSLEELLNWHEAVRTHGRDGLKISRLMTRRPLGS